MNDRSSTEIEARVGAAMRSIAATHDPDIDTARTGLTGRSRGPNRHGRWWLAAASVAIIAVGVAAIASTRGNDASSRVDDEAAFPSTSADPATTVMAPVPVTVTDPSTPPPTIASTTIPSTDAPATPGSGWVISEDSPSAVVQGWSGNWWGEGVGPSPAAPNDDTEPVADGTYAVQLLTPWEPGDDHLRLRIQRLEWCSDLPTDVCGQDASEELGPDPSWELDLDVPLDDSTRVVLQGYECRSFSNPDAGELMREQNKAGTGADLRDLFEAFTADYGRVIEPYLNTDYWSDLSALQTDVETMSDPGGFRTGRQVCPEEQPPDADYDASGILRYVHDNAPVLLLQSIEGWNNPNPDVDAPLRATDLVSVVGVDYTDGQPTFFFYAGFRS